MKEPTSYLLNELLQLNSIKIDKRELEFQFESHPSYPSLHSITGVLNHFGIENLAIEVPRNEETLNELPGSFIAHVEDDEGEHFVLTNRTGQNIELVYNKQTKKVLSKEAFFQFWTGILVAVEKTEDFVEKKESNLAKNAIYFACILGILLVIFHGNIGLFGTAHFFIAVIGAAISVIIVQHELGVHSVVVDKFCSGNNEKTSCDDVLNSKGATIIRNVKFSDVGLVYFLGVIISWIFTSFMTNPNVNLLVAFSLTAIPFTFYSLIYQRFVVKKWCPLCLSILAVLWVHAASLFLYKSNGDLFQVNVGSIISITFSFIVVSLLWSFIYPKLKVEQEHKKLKIEHNRFKNNYGIFNALISRRERIDTEINNSLEIVLGDKSKNPLLKVVLVTNPLCGHCKVAHQSIEPLLKYKEKGVQIVIRFNIKNDKANLDTKVASTLLAIYHTRTEEEIIMALNEAYSGISLTVWLERWKTEIDEKYFEEVEREKQWCHENNISFTPEILVNGRSFPQEYDRTDLKYFIDDIIEEELHENEEVVSESSFAIETY